MGYTPQFGYSPNPERTEQIVSQWKYQSIKGDLPELMAHEKRDTYLWPALLACKPGWRRGAQKIGDCVSWGGEMVCTMLMAMQAAKGKALWVEEGATESLYGLRVEIDPSAGNDGDGWYGGGCAEALTKYGICMRLDYSKDTGNPDHDMRVYSGPKASNFGRYGCGGKNDKGVLDKIASQHPCKGVVKIKTVEEAMAAIAIGCPLTIASNVGFGSMKRNSDGIVRRSGSWNHQMSIIAGRYWKNEPQGRCCQSWGDSASGPDPGLETNMDNLCYRAEQLNRMLGLPDPIDTLVNKYGVEAVARSLGVSWDAISRCSWWITAEDFQDILDADDSYAFASVEGFDMPAYDWANNYLI